MITARGGPKDRTARRFCHCEFAECCQASESSPIAVCCQVSEPFFGGPRGLPGFVAVRVIRVSFGGPHGTKTCCHVRACIVFIQSWDTAQI